MEDYFALAFNFSNASASNEGAQYFAPLESLLVQIFFKYLPENVRVDD